VVASPPDGLDASGAKYGPVRMCRVRRHSLQLRIDDEIHSLERKNPHQTFIPQYSGLGEIRTVVEPDFDRLDAGDAHSSGIGNGEATDWSA
jgi:hypothetical protein